MQDDRNIAPGKETACRECHAGKPFFIQHHVAEREWVSICFACGARHHRDDEALSTSRLKHKCQARLFLG